MTTLREAAQQALEALGHVVRQAQENLVPTIHYGPVHDVMNNLRAALAQQAEPVEPVALKHRHEWFSTGGMEPGQFRCIHCGVWGQEQSDPQIEDRLARHGINPCPDCRGIGYDASGQLCWCQQNPSF